MNDLDIQKANAVLRVLQETSDYIVKQQQAFELRRRFNPHHAPELVQIEQAILDQDLKDKFTKMKMLYIENRNLIMELPYINNYQKETVDALEKIIGDDLEKEFDLGST